MSKVRRWSRNISGDSLRNAQAATHRRYRVVQCRNGDTRPRVFAGIYRKRTEKAITIGKRNPVAEIELARDHVKDIHRVLTTNELFGV
jgi:hypothetical protein